MRSIMSGVMAQHRATSFEEMIATSYDEAIGPPDGALITPQKIEAFAHAVATRFVRYLEHTGELEGVMAGLEAKRLI
jgi:hypothetical protein